MNKNNELDVLTASQNEATVSIAPFPEQSAVKKSTPKKALVYDEDGERTVSKSEVRSMTGIVNRQDAFTMDPRSIVVDEKTNPRIDYGNDEEWQEHVDSIRSMGVREAIQVYVREDKAGNRVFHLAQGFRRMRAVMQIIAENPEAIKTVPVTIGDGNRERILLDHLVLNGSKELLEIEKAGIIAQLANWSYEVKDIAQMTKYSESKVRRYIDLINGASQQIINAIQNNSLSISNAIDLVKSTPDTLEQNKKLNKAKEVAQSKVKVVTPKAATLKPVVVKTVDDFDAFADDNESESDLDLPKLTKAAPKPTSTPILASAAKVVVPAAPLKLRASDFADSPTAKKMTSSLEYKVSSLLEIVDKESMQFPDDIDMVFVDRVKDMFKMLNKGSSNYEIMKACFNA